MKPEIKQLLERANLQSPAPLKARLEYLRKKRLQQLQANCINLSPGDVLHLETEIDSTITVEPQLVSIPKQA